MGRKLLLLVFIMSFCSLIVGSPPASAGLFEVKGNTESIREVPFEIIGVVEYPDRFIKIRELCIDNYVFIEIQHPSTGNYNLTQFFELRGERRVTIPKRCYYKNSYKNNL